jgi:hypothetical protein
MRRVWWEFRHVVHGGGIHHVKLRARLVAVTLATAVVDVVGTLLAWLFDHHAHGTGFTSMGGALFWVTTQLTTVSSQLPNPISVGARILDVFLQIWAITVVATLAGSFGAFFHGRHMEEAERS